MGTYKPSKLRERGIRAKKSLSQNFLIDRNIIQKICKVADIKEDDTVLEIGPGPGAITEELLNQGAKIIAVEKDEELAKNLPKSQNLQVFAQDALLFSYDTLPKKSKIVSNLPFQIAIPLIEKWIELSQHFESATIVVQKEVGERMVAKKNTKEYGRLSLFIQAYSDPTYAFTIKRTSFYPRPAIDACVIHLKLKPFPFLFPVKPFFAFVKSAFSQRRKMLRSTLKEEYPNIEAVLEKPTVRPGELSLEEFASLFEKVRSYKEKTP